MPDGNNPSYLPIIREIFEPFGVARDIPRHQGVTWSGMGPDAEELAWREACAESRRADERARIDAVRASPVGQLRRCFRELDRLGWHEEAFALEGEFDRNSLNAKPITGPVAGAMLCVLHKVNHSAAREAIGIIAELLLEDGRRAA